MENCEGLTERERRAVVNIARACRLQIREGKPQPIGISLDPDEDFNLVAVLRAVADANCQEVKADNMQIITNPDKTSRITFSPSFARR